MDEFRESLDECISAFSPENLAYKSTCSYLKNLHETVPRLKSEKKNIWNSNWEDHSRWVIEPKELAKGRNQKSQVNKLAEGGKHRGLYTSCELNII